MTRSDRASIPAAFASLRVMGESQHLPSLCTAYFEIEPEVAYCKNDTYETKRGLSQTRRKSVWIYSTENAGLGADVQKHVAAIAMLVAGREAATRRFIENMQADLLVSVFWHGQSTDLTPHVEQSFDALIEACGGMIDCDFARDCVAAA